MTGRVALRSARLVVPLLMGLLTSRAMAQPRDAGSRLLSDLDVVESVQTDLCATKPIPSNLAETLRGLAGQARADLSAGSDGRGAVEALNRLIFSHLGIRGSPDLKDPCNLLPSPVIARKKGYCVGIAAIYLALAERLGLPVFAVATPSHVFLRYDDGKSSINIETLQQGAGIPDEQYIREQKIPETSIRRGVFMRNLTTDEFLAHVHNNLGVIYSERKDFKKAAKEYERALDLDPRLPAAWYNYGNDLLRQNEPRRAVRYFTRSLRLYPADALPLNNRGLAFTKMGKIEKARRDFQEALRIDPGFEQAKQNLQGMPAPP